MLRCSVITILAVAVQLASGKPKVANQNSSAVFQTMHRKYDFDVVLPKSDALTFLKRPNRAVKGELRNEFGEECCNEDNYCSDESIEEWKEEFSAADVAYVICEQAFVQRKQCKCDWSAMAYPKGHLCGHAAGFASGDYCPDPCGDKYYHCGANTGNVCYPKTVECDSVIDCPNKADESSCKWLTTNPEDGVRRAEIIAGTKLAVGAQRYCDIKFGKPDGHAIVQSQMTAAQCIEHCLNQAKSDSTINGMYVHNSNSKYCYCMQNSKRIISHTWYFSCIFEASDDTSFIHHGHGTMCDLNNIPLKLEKMWYHCRLFTTYSRQECQRLCTSNYYDSKHCTKRRRCQFAEFKRISTNSEDEGMCTLFGDNKNCVPTTNTVGALKKNSNLHLPYYQVLEKKLENMAFGKPTSQSGDRTPSSRANDGNRFQKHFKFCSYGAEVKNPFWMVDLKKNVKIHSIKMYLRLDCCPNRYNNIKIWIRSDRDENWTMLKHYSQIRPSYANPVTELKLPYTRTARFVKVIQENPGKHHELTICEFEVFGRYQDSEYCDLFPGTLMVPYRSHSNRIYANFNGEQCAKYCMEINKEGASFIASKNECQCVFALRTGIRNDRSSDRQSVACKRSSATLAPLGACPTSHPYAYHNGGYCCKYDREKIYAPHGASCDGGALGISSTCCKDDQFAGCGSPPCANNAADDKTLPGTSDPSKHYLTMGKKNFGSYQAKRLCRDGNAVTGFRIRVHRQSGLHGIELACTDGFTPPPETGLYGTWTDWTYCDITKTDKTNNYATSFNYRSQHNNGATDIKMKCSNGQTLNGNGLNGGTWDRDSKDMGKCIGNSYLCGVQVQTGQNGMNQIRFICCTMERLLTGPYESSSSGSKVYSGNVYVLDRPVCDKGWDDDDAKVICKTLSFTNVKAYSWKSSKFGLVNQDFIMTNVRCGGLQTSIAVCQLSTLIENCAITQAAGVTCVDFATTKLVGGEDATEGNVYIIHQPVCDTDWGLNEAKVVCNQLFAKQFVIRPEGVPVFNSYRNSAYGGLPGSGTALKISCNNGAEKHLGECKLNINVPCPATKRAGAKCAKCTPDILLGIMDLFVIGAEHKSTYESIGTAYKALHERCHKWNCTDTERSYTEYCMIDAFLIDSQLTMDAAMKIPMISLDTTINYGSRGNILFQSGNFQSLKSDIQGVADQMGSFQKKLARHFANIAKFEEDKNREDLRMITNKWQSTKDEIGFRQHDMRKQLKILFAASLLVGYSELSEFTAQFFSMTYGINPFTDLNAEKFFKLKDLLKQMALTTGKTLKVVNAMTSCVSIAEKIMKKIAVKDVKYVAKYNKIKSLLDKTGDFTVQDARFYLANYHNFAVTVWPTDVRDFEAQLTEMIAATCDWLKAPSSASGAAMVIPIHATGVCPKVKANLKVVIAGYLVCYTLVRDIKGKLSAIATSKIAQHGAKQLSKVLGGTLRREIEKRTTRANILLFLKLERVTFIREACDYITYFHHGRQTTYCKRLLDNPFLSFKDILDFNYANDMCKCTDCIPSRRTVYIPAVVPDPDTPLLDGTIDLSALYTKKGNGIDGWSYFRIPNNKWLHDNGWLEKSKKTEGPFFLTKFELYYPAATDTAYKAVTYSVHTHLTLETNELNGKAYPIDPPVKVSSEYEENPTGSCNYKSKIDVHPYDICATHGKLCVISDGRIYGKIYPSLVGSTWKINLATVAKLTRPDPATVFYIQAKVEFCYNRRYAGYNDPTHIKRRLQRTKRSNKCSCGANEHYNPTAALFVKCTRCPTNSAPRLGGYFCEECGIGYEQSIHSKTDTTAYGCVPCKQGYFKQNRGNSRCLRCPSGTTTGTETGADRCKKSRPGRLVKMTD